MSFYVSSFIFLRISWTFFKQECQLRHQVSENNNNKENANPQESLINWLILSLISKHCKTLASNCA